MSNRAWVTLATNDSYGLGALVLAHSLQRAGSIHPAVVLITPSVTDAMKERLRAVFADVVTVDVLDSKDATHLALLQRPELGITFTKIHCWSLTQYEKCVFLDADALVVQNCDELFDREELSAAPDVGWPDCFNSGVFVFKPSQETYEQLIKFAQERGSFDGGDQGLLNSFFSDWARGDINKHLPFLYNVTSAAFYSYLPALKHYGQNLKIIHFIGAAKPWLQQYNWESRSVDAPDHLREFLQLWWDLFVGQVHSQLDVTMAEVLEDSPAEPPPDLRQHYEPLEDPESEFPWHHPGAIQPEESVPEIDLTQFYDPWQLYRGNIPPNTDDASATQPLSGRIDDHEQMKQYAWAYQPSYTDYNPPHFTDHSHKEHQTNPHFEYHSHAPSHHSYDYSQHAFHDHPGQHWQQDSIQDQQRYYDHTTYHHEDNQKSDQGNEYFHDHQIQSHESHSSHDNHLHIEHDSKHAHHNTDTAPLVLHTQTYYHALPNEFKEKQDNPVNETIINGDVSESESDYQEELKPRHPYDNFYMRHRAVIDSYGRKICMHEIPLTPSPSPPPEEIDDNDLLDDSHRTFNEETVFTNGNEDHVSFDENNATGVAGNLARVVGGASAPREALDELSRRQGWEAGLVDYMGADSFDNIWAKISQTLNQRTSPPKQLSPPKDQPPAPVDVVQPVNAPIPESVSSSAPTELPVPLDTPVVVEAPKPTDVAVETIAPQTEPLVETAAAVDEPAASIVVSTPVQTVVPAEQPASIEAVVPVETVAAVETVAPVETAPVETTTPVETEPVETTTPVETAPVETTTPVETATVESLPPETSIEIPTTVEKLVESQPTEIPTTVEAIASPPDAPKKPEVVSSDIPAPVEAIAAGEVPVAPKASTLAAAPDLTKEISVEKTEPVLPPTPPASPKSTQQVPAPEAAAQPVVEVVEAAKVPESVEQPVVPETLPVTPSKAQESGSESPPLAHTPSKGEAPSPAAKSEERRKAGKLCLQAPVAGDPLPTPDSELEDAASLASCIIERELAAPAITPASASTLTPEITPTTKSPKLPSADDLEPPTTVSLAQIGVKPKTKPTTAAQIESSLTEKLSSLDTPTPPSPETTTAPKKKIVKKVVKKESASGDASAPVPPPRKKEKKPKEK